MNQNQVQRRQDNVPPSQPAQFGQPARIGQATAVEQSRAVAEVQAAIVVAQQCPRNTHSAMAAMRESCAQKGLAERAFYRFPRAGGAVSGPSVHLARELARCWGNIQYGVAELRRDDEYGQSEMQAWAWDVQTNARSSLTFIVPHKRDVKGGPKKLEELRDIYENNANNGARRLREVIFSVLPAWFVEEAKDLCAKTLQDGGGRPLAQRVADAVHAFEGIGITVDQMEQKVSRKTEKWTEHDVAQFGVIFKSIQRGEVSRDEEFPPPQVTADELVGPAGEKPQAATKSAKADAPDPQ
ncbi:hypothetical protein [Marinitenerispora sediminis]|uniref:Uncharacterized protein n=1 Tax=Marinitenerispora sediminis TaxID=1931232 RepID=A0A368T740_9ACTN|nr:hypothetical protein [Marinitenerispora sediminis]RCV51185.1 hypothetical protein DEF23_20900 [Marinitenerispora sediminis]RCV59335.1 hypothetical protein DEF24_10205 [Marinitenerispora sediminis]